MATATLNFDLNDYDDIQSHLRCVKSLDLALALWEFGHNTKKSFEYDLGDDDKSHDLVDKIYSRFWEILDEKGIKLDDLIT
jgi:hypothetical protein